QAQPDLLRLAENDVLERLDRALQRSGAGIVHDSMSLRTRESCASRPLAVRSNSARRSRSVATTAGGALRTKLSFASFLRAFSRSCFARARSLLRRSASAAASIRPAMGTRRLISPT